VILEYIKKELNDLCRLCNAESLEKLKGMASIVDPNKALKE